MAMTGGSVKILFCNNNADAIVASAGRISTTKGGANEIYDKSCERDSQENVKLIGKILSSGHTSVLEHVSVNMAFENVSVFVEEFIIEFRLASFTVKSRRYVDFGKMGYVLPDFEKYGSEAGRIEKIYKNHMDYLFSEYNDFVELGIPKEDARFLLPYCFHSNFYCTANARELVKIVNEMVYGRGSVYPELVSLGKSIMDQCSEKLPFLKFGSDASYHADELGEKIKACLEKKKAGKKAGAALADEEIAGKTWKAGLSNTPLCDGREVAILNATPDAEKNICRAALAMHGITDFEGIDLADPELARLIIKEAVTTSRKRELEQAAFTILFKKVSLSGVTHLVRHRMQSILVPNYVDTCDFEKFILPESILKAGLKERYQEAFAKSARVSDELTALGYEKYDRIYLFLSGLTIPVITTMNGNELFTFIRLRTCSRAQWEIAGNARELLSLLRKLSPVLFSLYGPTCFMTGKCPEGKMSCGRMKEIREEFTADI